MGAPTTDRGGIQQVIRTMRAAGWTLDSLWDGEESFEHPNETEALDYGMQLDQFHLYFTKGDETGWVFFVLGNDPDEVVNDYTLNLDPTMDELQRSWW